ncbi:MAG: endonuclease III [Nitrospinae bacterium]|nr:endonuclease III [Nitrospinota bacterium]
MLAADHKQRAAKIASALARAIPHPNIELTFTSPLELLVATILSAQCTDERVNKVTAALFKKYRDASGYAAAPPGALEEDIRPTGFYQNKAKALRAMAARLVERHGGRVPDTMEDLTALPGVGRKTANVILGGAFGKPGIVVDTHVIRVSGRLGLSRQGDPVKIENDLMALLPEREWTAFSQRLVLFGRYTCKAKIPLCGECPLFALCQWKDKEKFAKKA